MNHNYKIGQKVYVPQLKEYWYINGITSGNDHFTLSNVPRIHINREPNKATNAKGTIRVSPSQIEVVS